MSIKNNEYLISTPLRSGSPKGATKRSAKKKKEDFEKLWDRFEDSDLKETVSRWSIKEKDRMLMDQILAEVQAQKKITQAKIMAIKESVKIYMLKVLRDLSLQRMESFNQSHKAWLKVMFA